METEWKKVRGTLDFDRFSKMNDSEKRIYYFIDGHYLPDQTMARMYKKGDNIILAVRIMHWEFKNNRFFIKSKFDTLATVTPRRIFSSNINYAGEVLCYLLDVDKGRTSINRTLFRQILKTGQQAIIDHNKKICKYDFLPGNPGDIKAILDGDIKEFSDRCGSNHELCDLYKQALALNRRIKMSWSDRKIHDLHMKWTEEIQAIKCKNCSDELIWKQTISLPPNTILLNSEKMIANEGIKMHHCIYTNYCNSLIRKFHIAFHMNDFTVMFTNYVDGLKLNQAYKAYNKQLTPEELKEAMSLLSYAEQIIDLNKSTQTAYDTQTIYEDVF